MLKKTFGFKTVTRSAKRLSPSAINLLVSQGIGNTFLLVYMELFHYINILGHLSLPYKCDMAIINQYVSVFLALQQMEIISELMLFAYHNL